MPAHGIVDPVLDTARVQTVIVVVSATVPAPVAHIRDEHRVIGHIGHIGPGFQEDATTGVAGANIAGYRPESPRPVDNSSEQRRPDTPLPIPHRGVRWSHALLRRGRAVSDDGCRGSFGPGQRAG